MDLNVIVLPLFKIFPVISVDLFQPKEFWHTAGGSSPLSQSA